MRVQMAQAALPAAPSPAFGATQALLSPDRKTVTAALTLPADSPATEIAAIAPEGMALGEITVDPMDAGRARITIAVTRIAPSFAGGNLTLLVKSGERALETTLALR